MRPRPPGTSVDSESCEDDDSLVDVMVGESAALERRAMMSVGRKGGQVAEATYFLASFVRLSAEWLGAHYQRVD